MNRRVAAVVVAALVGIGGVTVVAHSAWHTSPPPAPKPKLAVPICPVPVSFVSNTTYTFTGCQTVPPGGFNLVDLTNVTIDGGVWQDANVDPCPYPRCGGGSHLGRAAFTIVGGSNITLKNLNVNGANKGGYHYRLAFNAGINVEGTTGVTIDHVAVGHVFGDCLTLGARYQGVDPHVVITHVTNAVVATFSGTACGRQGIAAVAVHNLTASNVTIGTTGFESLDFEADVLGLGAEHVMVDGCSLIKPINLSGGGRSMGPVTVSNCAVTGASGDAVVVRNLNGTTLNGSLVFDHDIFRCGSSQYVACLQLDGATSIVVSNSAIQVGFSFNQRGKLYAAGHGTNLTLAGDTVTGFVTKTPGSRDSTSTVTIK